MAIQKQERKITYTGQTREEENGEESSTYVSRVRKKTLSEIRSVRRDENGDEIRKMQREETEEIEADPKPILMEKNDFGGFRSSGRHPDGEPAAAERKIFEAEDVPGEVMPESSETGMSVWRSTSRSSRNFSTYEANSDERVAFSDNEAGERIVRMDEVRRFRNQKANPEVKETVLLDTGLEEESGRDQTQDLAVHKKERETGNHRIQENEQNQVQENAAYRCKEYGAMEQETVSGLYDLKPDSETGTEMWKEDSGESAESPGRAFHRGRNSFCYTGSPMQVSEGSVGTQMGTQYGTRNFSKNSRRMEAEINAGAGQSFGQTQGMGRAIHKTEQKAQEAAKEAQHTAREAGKTAGKTVGETIDSISQYSELVTRPYETGKRTFSAGKETVSKQFQSVKEMASSAKDVDETIGSKSKELLKAMAVRTFREAVTLPVRLARAVIKTATTVAATISTGGINLIIMLIALIFAGAVLVSMIVFAGTMLIAYGVSEGLLSF